MIDHKLHWPELGYDAYRENNEADWYEQWMNHRLLRWALWFMIIVSDIVYLSLTIMIAMYLLPVISDFTGSSIGGGLGIWAFAGAVGLVMILDEVCPRGKHSTLRYGSRWVVARFTIALIRLYAMYKHRSKDLGEPTKSGLDRIFLPRLGLSRGKDKLD
jgi:hypothetical protein